jgi:hypothetical protein
MPPHSSNRRHLEAAEGYTTLGLYLLANQELERMTAETRQWPEVLAVKLGIFDGLELWELVEIVAQQLADSAHGNPRWAAMAEQARIETLAARRRASIGLIGKSRVVFA